MAILQGLRSRVAPTVIVWVKGHCGDLGNTMADRYAEEGCAKEEEKFPRETKPMAFYGMGDGTALSPAGWTSAVETAARVYQGRVSAIRLCAPESGPEHAFAAQGAFGEGSNGQGPRR